MVCGASEAVGPARLEPVAATGARVAATPREVFRSAEQVIVMLCDEGAIDAVLERGRPGFGEMLQDRTLIVMGTNSPAYSLGLETDVQAVGGKYVEAPVSGSRGPAIDGQLVAMLAGADPTVVDRIRALIAPMTRHVVDCGPVPAALTTKIAVNAYMITMVTGLVEAVHLADRAGLERRALAEVLLSGPLTSPLLRAKLDKLVAEDDSPQAAIADVAKNTGLIAAAARAVGAATPLADICHELFSEAVASGHGSADLIAVLDTLHSRPVE